ncbi:MAG: hypothetical protein IPL40_07425 [Proteobacteria bacterium]|nr:hypothetical protein [Pseudomonadota bacterium]
MSAPAERPRGRWQRARRAGREEALASRALLLICVLLATSTVTVGWLGYRAGQRAQRSVLRMHAAAAAAGLLAVARSSGALGDEAALSRLLREQARGPAKIVLTDLDGRLLAAGPGRQAAPRPPSAQMLAALHAQEPALRFVRAADGIVLEYWVTLPTAQPAGNWWQPSAEASTVTGAAAPPLPPSPGELWREQQAKRRLLRVTVPVALATALLAPARWGLALAIVLALLGLSLALLLHRVARSAGARQREQLRDETLAAFADTAGVLAEAVGVPAASIEHRAQQLAEAQPGDPQLAMMLRDGRRLRTLVERLKELAAPCQPRLALVDPDLIAGRAVEALRVEATHAGVTIIMDPAACGSCLLADDALMTQVLVHLLHNAVEAVAALPPALAAGRRLVVLRVRRGAGLVRFAVLDQGAGLGGAERNPLARPFFSTKASGAGLGLSLARRIVVEHGGRLELSDRPEGGAVATVELSERGLR